MVASAMHRIQHTVIVAQRKQRRIGQPVCMLHLFPGAAPRIDAIDVDAVPAAVAVRRGIATDISEHAFPPYSPIQSRTHPWITRTAAMVGSASVPGLRLWQEQLLP